MIIFVFYKRIRYSIMLIICCHISKDETKDNIRQVQETEEDDAANYDETYDALADLIESRMNMRSVSFSY
jgi:hypothetical protein